MQKRTHLTIFISLLLMGIILDIAPIVISEGTDKICHFVGFFAITLSAIATFNSFFSGKWINQFLFFTLTIGVLFAGLSESAQRFFPIRGCSVYDWIANLGGISLACVLFFLLNIKNDSEENHNSL